jgi:hypothetical protein
MNNLAYIGKKPSAISISTNEWFTPPKYIEMVKEVLGEITLDPFSCNKANEIVKAKSILTIDDDALNIKWDNCQSVFMNPPYSANLCSKACNKFIEELPNINRAIVLTNNATETKWCQRLMVNSQAICFTNHRVSFWNSDGKKISNNTRGQLFFLFGKYQMYLSKFIDVFTNIGFVSESGYHK